MELTAFAHLCQGWGYKGVQGEAPSSDLTLVLLAPRDQRGGVLHLGNETQEQTDSCFEMTCEWYLHTHFI